MNWNTSAGTNTIGPMFRTLILIIIILAIIALPIFYLIKNYWFIMIAIIIIIMCVVGLISGADWIKKPIKFILATALILFCLWAIFWFGGKAIYNYCTTKRETKTVCSQLWTEYGVVEKNFTFEVDEDIAGYENVKFYVQYPSGDVYTQTGNNEREPFQIINKDSSAYATYGGHVKLRLLSGPAVKITMVTTPLSENQKKDLRERYSSQ